jgi:hypothetical protein
MAVQTWVFSAFGPVPTRDKKNKLPNVASCRMRRPHGDFLITSDMGVLCQLRV